jgi:soluble lytic murein transglycosylase-like protein
VAIDRKSLVTLALVGVAAYIGWQYWVQSQSQGDSDSETDPTDSATTGSITDTLQTLWENALVSTGVTDWRSVGEGPTYLPYLNTTEAQYAIPTDLLARIAYQESHFRADIISGATKSPAGAVGIMQLMPQYFPGAGENPMADIATAGQYLAKLYQQFGDWQVAVAAYNDGPGNLAKYEAGTLTTLPLETQNYVADVFADVPVQGSLIQVS